MFIEIAKYNMKRIDGNDTLSFQLYDRTLQQIKGRLNTIKKCNNKILQSVQVTPQVETTETPADTAQTSESAVITEELGE